MDLSGFLTFWGLFKLMIYGFLLYFIYAFIIKPYYLTKFYEKQGLYGRYVPMIGYLAEDFLNVHRHGDFIHKWKEVANMDPKPRGFVGPVMGVMSIFLQDPELIKEFLQTRSDEFVKDERLFGIYLAVLDKGLAFSEGKLWKRHRKYVSMAFHYDFLKQMIPEVVKIVDTLLTKLPIKGDSSLNIMEAITAITGEVVGRLFFGEVFSEHSIQGKPITTFMAELMARVGSETTNPLFLMLGMKFIRAGFFEKHRKLLSDIAEMKALANQIISKRMNDLEVERKKGIKQERKTLIDVFYDQRQLGGEDPLSDDELIDEFLTFFVAGMDTTGHTVAMATYYFLKNPEFQQKLMTEVDTIFSDPSKVSIESLNQMEYMTMFIKETLRKATPALFVFDRVANKDICLKDLQIKQGTRVNIPISAMAHDGRIYENPEKFNPDRWSPSGPLAKVLEKNPYSFVPFSMGPRNCIGQHLAMNEAKIIISLFLKKFKYEMADQNYNLRFTMRFAYEPVDPLLYKINLK